MAFDGNPVEESVMSKSAVEPIEVRAGQVYEDVKEKTGRRLLVLSVDLQKETVGRFKARYTYAKVLAYGGITPYTKRGTTPKTLRVDTDRLKKPYCYKLVWRPCEENCDLRHVHTPIVDLKDWKISTEELFSTHSSRSDASAPQQEP